MDGMCRQKTESVRRVTGARDFPVSNGRPPSAVFRYPSSAGGFTLIELIVATAISALVIGIVSVCFSFALRVWENTQNRRPDKTFQLAELLQRQLAECDPTPIKFDNGERTLFIGRTDSIAFVTAHSVKAISQGVPVVARYTYDPDSRVLSYSEIVLNPYNPASIERFAAGRYSSAQQTGVFSYVIDFPKFALSYAGKNSQEFSQSWDSADKLPVEVLVGWKGNDSAAHSLVCMVNSPFPIQADMLIHSTGFGGLNQ